MALRAYRRVCDMRDAAQRNSIIKGLLSNKISRIVYSFILNGLFNSFLLLKILLTSANNTNITKSKIVNFALKGFQVISSFVHKVKLSDNLFHNYSIFPHEKSFSYTNSTISFRINFSSKLQRIRVCEISISSSNSQNDCVGIFHICLNHCSDLLFNIRWLIPNWNLL